MEFEMRINLALIVSSSCCSFLFSERIKTGFLYVCGGRFREASLLHYLVDECLTRPPQLIATLTWCPCGLLNRLMTASNDASHDCCYAEACVGLQSTLIYNLISICSSNITRNGGFVSLLAINY